MDEKLDEIIEFEKKSLRQIDEAGIQAQKEIGAFVRKMDELRNSEFDRIRRENRERTERLLDRAREAALTELKALKRKQERLLNDNGLKSEVKEMIISVISESV